MRKFYLIIIISFLSSTLLGQDKVSAKIIGKWQLVKHTVKDKNGKGINRLKPDEKVAFEFYKDGTFKLSYSDKNGSGVNKGKWKITENSKNLYLYNIKMDPSIENVFIPESENKSIVILNKTDLIIKEYRLDIQPIGLSYFKKQK